MNRIRLAIGIMCCGSSAALMAIDRSSVSPAGGTALLVLGVTLIATARCGKTWEPGRMSDSVWWSLGGYV